MQQIYINRKKENKLTLERLHNLLDYNPKTGVFTYKVNSSNNRKKKGDIAGYIPKCYHRIGNITYRRISIDYQSYAAHRLAWFYYYGVWPGNIIDHINNDNYDNSIANLRDVSHRINSLNRKNNKNKELIESILKKSENN